MLNSIDSLQIPFALVCNGRIFYHSFYGKEEHLTRTGVVYTSFGSHRNFDFPNHYIRVNPESYIMYDKKGDFINIRTSYPNSVPDCQGKSLHQLATEGRTIDFITVSEFQTYVKNTHIQITESHESLSHRINAVNTLDNTQNEQLAAAYIKIASLEDKIENLEDKNEQLWNLVCQSKVVDCNNVIIGQVLNEESEL